MEGVTIFEEYYQEDGQTTFPSLFDTKVAETAYKHINCVLCSSKAWYELVIWFGVKPGEILPSALNKNTLLEADSVPWMFRNFLSPLECTKFPENPFVKPLSGRYNLSFEFLNLNSYKSCTFSKASLPIPIQKDITPINSHQHTPLITTPASNNSLSQALPNIVHPNPSDDFSTLPPQTVNLSAPLPFVDTPAPSSQPAVPTLSLSHVNIANIQKKVKKPAVSIGSPSGTS